MKTCSTGSSQSYLKPALKSTKGVLLKWESDRDLWIVQAM